MRPRKISTIVPPEQHAQLTKIAHQNKTTIGEILRWGAGLAVAVAKAQNGMQVRGLAPDHRRKGE